MAVQRITLTVKEAATMLGVSRKYLYHLISTDPDRAPPFRRVGRWSIRFPREDFDAWIHQRST